MKTRPLLLLLLLVGITSLTGCKTTEEAKNFTEEFLTQVVNQEFDQAATKISALAANGADVSSRCKLMYDNPDYGKLQSFEKGMGFNTSIQNGISTVQLNYDLTYEKGEVTYGFVLVDRGAGFKIEGIK